MTTLRSPLLNTNGSMKSIEAIIGLLYILDPHRLCIISHDLRVEITIRIFTGAENIRS